MHTLGKAAAALEVYSIDEAFLRLDGKAEELRPRGQQIRALVRQHTGIPVGVGIGATKILAKLANRHAKRHGGVYTLDHQSKEGRALLDAWPCQELWGVAGRLAARLVRLGIHTAGELARAPRRAICQQFGVVGKRLVLELSGVSCLELEEVQADRKNICCSRSFGRPVESLEELREAVTTHATRAGEKLRAQGLAASAIHVFMHTNPRRPELPQYSPGAGRELLVPTAFTSELIGDAMRVLKAIYKPGYRYIKAGVLCLGLVPDEEKQASLFRPVDPAREEKERRLMEAVDKLNLWGGRGTVRTATLGGAKPQGWQMRRDHKTPCYTTRIEDVPRARV